jgi:endonuclease/exonuclease/phosphatase family metal-dependent hydrolase
MGAERMTIQPFVSALIVVVVTCHAGIADDLTITTWNIEHLGSPGRGFGGGFGGGDLPKRGEEQLKQIAAFIKTDLKSDVLAVQEIAITRTRLGRSYSDPLETITKELNQAGDAKWHYYLPSVKKTPPDKPHNEYLGFLWNAKRVRLLKVFEMDLKNQDLAGKNLFDRMPLVGYFEALDEDGKSRNDFVLVNVHLGSGQDNDESHLIAMTLIEFELARNLGKNAVTESDIVILGDFNDNPHAEKNGKKKYSPALYEHMKFNGYVDLVTADMKTTRMNDQLDSLIDHVLVNKGAKNHIAQDKATIFQPGNGDSSQYAEWRRTFSDHFPLSFPMKITADDDADFFD